MKKIIKGKELKANFGGWSRYSCPACHERLAVHISHKSVKKKTRYFCCWCGKKFNFLPTDKPGFIELYDGELPKVFRSFFRDTPQSVID